MDRIEKISLNQLHTPWCILRPVRHNSLEFMELCDSIREVGLLNSISVRPSRREGMYEIIDGNWRFEAHKTLDLPEICGIIKVGISDDDVLGLQIMANAVHYETEPIQFAQHMQRIITRYEDAGLVITIKSLAQKVGKCVPWVSKRLNLLKLHEDVQAALSNGVINLSHASALARLNKHTYQLKYLEFAKTHSGRETELEVGRFARRVADEMRGLIRDESQIPQLRPYLQSVDTLLKELDGMEQVSRLIIQEDARTAIEGARLTLEWVMNLHADGREKQLENWKNRLTFTERRDIIGKQRYAELAELRQLREKRTKKRDVS